VVVGKLVFSSFKLFLGKEKGGGEYQPTQGNKTTRQ
jgi:hypothetical protein